MAGSIKAEMEVKIECKWRDCQEKGWSLFLFKETIVIKNDLCYKGIYPGKQV